MADCDECGFTYGHHRPPEVVHELHREVEVLAGLVAGAAEGDLRRRPGPEVWSPLEYACHLRDVLLCQRERLYLALVEECPSFPPLYRDQRSVLARYADEEPAPVTSQLRTASELLGWALAGLDDGGWRQTLIYNYPAPAEHDVRWLAQHTLHECVHHRGDVARALGGPPPGR